MVRRVPSWSVSRLRQKLLVVNVIHNSAIMGAKRIFAFLIVTCPAIPPLSYFDFFDILLLIYYFICFSQYRTKLEHLLIICRIPCPMHEHRYNEETDLFA